jgi:ABC-type branched-subunit amino acid transport system substrate-binding protein
VIGGYTDAETTALASLSSLYRIPHVSYGATAPNLSDGSTYRSHARTLGSMTASVTALLAVLRHYKFHDIAVIHSDDAYGHAYTETLTAVADGVTGPTYSTASQSPQFPISFELVRSFRLSNLADMRSALNAVKSTDVRVIVVVARRDQLFQLMKQHSELDMTRGFVTLTADTLTPALIASSTLTTEERSALITNMNGMLSVNVAAPVDNQLAAQLAAACRLALPTICAVPIPQLYYAYDAVIALANALHSACGYSTITGLPSVTVPEHVDVTQFLFESTFNGATGAVNIDDVGERLATYDLVNMVNGVFNVIGRWTQAQHEYTTTYTPSPVEADAVATVAATQECVTIDAGQGLGIGLGICQAKPPREKSVRARTSVVGTFEQTGVAVWPDGTTRVPAPFPVLRVLLLAPVTSSSTVDKTVGRLVKVAGEIALDYVVAGLGETKEFYFGGRDVELVHIDSGGTPMEAVPASVDEMARRRITGVVGGFRNYVTRPVATVANVFNVPVISYGATDIFLSNEQQFPGFSRTFPSEAAQAGAVYSVLDQYEWLRVCVVYDRANAAVAQLLFEKQAQYNLDNPSDPTPRYYFDFLVKDAETSNSGVPTGTFEGGAPSQETLDGDLARSMKLIRDRTASSIIVVLLSSSTRYANLLSWAVYFDMIGVYTFIGTETFKGNILDEASPNDRVSLFTRLNGALFVVPSLVDQSAGANSTATTARVYAECVRRDDLCDNERTQQHLIDPIFYVYDSMVLFFKAVSVLFRADTPLTMLSITDTMRSITMDGATGTFKLSASGNRPGRFEFLNVARESQRVVGNWEESTGFFVKSRDIQWVSGSINPPDGKVLLIQLLSNDNKKWIEWASYALLGFSCVLHGFVLVNQGKHAVKALNPIFLHMVLLGTVVGYFAVLANVLFKEDSRFHCQITPFLLGVSFSISFPALFSKVWNLHVIKMAINSRYRVVKHKEILIKVTGLLIYELVCFVGMLIFDPPLPRVEQRGVFTGVYVCNVDTLVWFVLLVIPKGIMLLFGLVIAFRVREDYHNYNEGARIFVAFLLTLSAIVILVILSNQEETNLEVYFFSYSGVMIMVQLLSILAVFWPLIYHFDATEGFHRRASIPGIVDANAKLPLRLQQGIAKARAEHRARMEASQRYETGSAPPPDAATYYSRGQNRSMSPQRFASSRGFDNAAGGGGGGMLGRVDNGASGGMRSRSRGRSSSRKTSRKAAKRSRSVGGSSRKKASAKKEKEKKASAKKRSRSASRASSTKKAKKKSEKKSSTKKKAAKSMRGRSREPAAAAMQQMNPLDWMDEQKRQSLTSGVKKKKKVSLKKKKSSLKKAKSPSSKKKSKKPSAKKKLVLSSKSLRKRDTSDSKGGKSSRKQKPASRSSSRRKREASPDSEASSPGGPPVLDFDLTTPGGTRLKTKARTEAKTKGSSSRKSSRKSSRSASRGKSERKTSRKKPPPPTSPPPRSKAKPKKSKYSV